MIRWVWAFLDRPAQRFDDCAKFWSTVTGTELSARRGEHDEFLTLLPDPALFAAAGVKMQAVTGLGGVHLDFDVDHIPTAVRTALDLGADLVANHPDYAVLRSPGGQTFCLTPSGRATSTPAPPVTAPDGTLSRLDQVCLDIGPADHAVETEFWKSLTGWTFQQGRLAEFARLRAEQHLPVQLLLQRLGEDRATSAHIDLASDDIEATATWHESLGATIVQRYDYWIVMADPADATYCVTARNPTTGLL
ncbi:VOC family protein [Nocardia brasiliensis]|uniref:VOC family protein n=1 Tax=Nocardia brasiliensis TaxID=37326 RepID=UPI0004A7470F|nr:VOC family protein [Nocardia brasiliensis]MBF6128709.1 VOC family protein [Nocardia brasiliensis]MBF6544305.1 VOC family protein [Nocardia brasiliensis]